MLNKKDSMLPGDDVWIVSAEDKETMDRLDWLFNFQLSRANKHKTPIVSPRLQNILDKCALKEFSFIENTSSLETEPSPLLISISQFVPALWLVVLNKKDLTLWSQQILHIWQKLNLKKTRLFLPAETSSSEFQQIWSQVCKNLNPSPDLTVVVQ